MRDKCGDTVEPQLKLARWCKEAGLPEQWRAHLGHVLQLDPDNQEARAALGYQRVGGGWMTGPEIGRVKARAAAANAALREWRPRLIKIRNGLPRGDERKAIAQERLDAIQDSTAVGAIEAVLCGDRVTALTGINKLAEMPAADASVSLARQALFSPWPPVRRAAVEKLKNRDRETFVPVLLSIMGSPIQSRVELFEDPSAGRLLYRHIFYRQGQERDQMAVFDSVYAPDDGTRYLIFDDGTRAVRFPNGQVQLVGETSLWGEREAANAVADQSLRRQPYPASAIPEALQTARIEAAATAQQREAAVARQNAMTEAMSRPICRLLNEVTGENLPDTPDAWSEWWAETDEVYVPGNKPRSVAYQQDPRVITGAGRPSVPAIVHYSPSVPAIVHYSCLAAGTPVWTESGPLAIERIRVGDRVLAQDPDTGQLAYKPVLHTTVREDAPLVRLDLLDDTITSSSGHPFWIAGQGWVKARDIGPYMHFHGAAGTTPLVNSQLEGTGRVYNLIVADFHSYFVGKAMVLSHDITRRSPSDVLVPGLAPHDAAGRLAVVQK
ncbi:MAG: polymorphic toxin-type HINT domain-containing protein [Thermoguttaceae bacterium]|jgi:hypothetical protein